MRRTVIVISLCFLLSVITTVIVAWWCVLSEGGGDSHWNVGEFEVNGWHGQIEARTGVVTVTAMNAAGKALEFPGLVDHLAVASTDSPDPVDPPFWIDLDDTAAEGSAIDALAAGWPWRCLHYVIEEQRPADTWKWTFDEHGMILGTNPWADPSQGSQEPVG